MDDMEVDGGTCSQSSGSESSSEKHPRDPFNFVAFSIFLFGIASLLPWNFFITANNYWQYKFRNVTLPPDSVNHTALQNSFNSDLSIASKLPYIFFLLVNTAISQRVSLPHRIRWPLVGCIVLFIVTTILAGVNTDNHQTAFLVITLTLVVFINVFCGFLQGGGTGLAGCLPTKYMAINVLGQATGGVFATLCQLACTLIGSSPTNSAIFYFSIATFLLCVTLGCFTILMRMDFYHYFMQRQATSAPENSMRRAENIPYLKILRQGWVFYTCVVLIFWVTISVFPAVTTRVDSSEAWTGARVNNDLFIILACFVTFNFFDLFGRMIAKFVPIPSDKGYILLAVCLGRIVFIPLFLMCNIPRTEETSNITSIVFSQDWQYVVIMVLFALSNGYVTTLSMTYASKSTSSEYQEISGSLAALFLGLGLALGSLSSAATTALI